MPELAEPLSNLDSLHNGTLAKTMFSMVTPDEEAIKVLQSAEAQSVVIFGLEVCTAFTRFLSGAYTILLQSHVCVLQTALDLADRGYQVNVLADGVSSANKEEVPLALERMRQAGVQVTTSESMIFQLIGESCLLWQKSSYSSIIT